MKKILASLCIAVGFTLTNFITFKYICNADEYWATFKGFPFVQSTDGPWVNSMSGELFIKGLLGNILFWTFLFYGLIYLFLTIKHKIYSVVTKGIFVVLCILSLVIIYFEITVFEWRLEWDHENFKMNYYQQDLDCKRSFHFFD